MSGTTTARERTYDRVLAAVHGLPGVEAATVTSVLPLGGQSGVNGIAVEGDTRPKFEHPNAN